MRQSSKFWVYWSLFVSPETDSIFKGFPVSAERPTLVDPVIEPMLESCENSKFTLVRVASMRAREITTYWSGLGRSQVNVIPPQVNSNSNKSLTMAFEELSEAYEALRRMIDRGYLPVSD